MRNNLHSLLVAARGCEKRVLGAFVLVLALLSLGLASGATEAAARRSVRELGRPAPAFPTVEAGKWSVVRFEAAGDPGGLPRGVLVRPDSWVEREGCEKGSTLTLEEEAMGLHLDVRVLSVRPVESLDVIPVVHTRRGPRHVISWVERRVERTLALGFERESTDGDAAGREGAPLEHVETTAEHPFHSADRAGWVAASDLRVGERVSLVRGGSATLRSRTLTTGPATVCNLEVIGEAEFAVGLAGITVHNAYKKQVGSYVNHHESGKKYIGKGDQARSQRSGRRTARETNDPHVATEFYPAEAGKGMSTSKKALLNESAFMDEARRIRAEGGVHGGNLYNKINSPGERMLRARGE